MVKKKTLFEQFPPVSTEEWMAKVNADLKGADFRKLVWKTSDGIEAMPFYREEDLKDIIAAETLPGEFPYRRGVKKDDNNWLVRQDISVTDYSQANSKALDILMKGVDSLGFIINDPSGINADNFRILLNNIQPEAVELNFLSNGKAKEILQILASIAEERDLSAENLKGAIEADPIGRIMTNGTLCIPVGEGFDYLAELTLQSLRFPNFRTIHIKASTFGDSGAGLVQELGYAISTGAEYMAQLTDRGLSAQDAASKIRFSFGVGPDYFPEIARLRAARVLWSVILKGFCGENCPEMNIHCTTANWNKTIYDPYVNMLRSQTETMSAVIGGTNSMTVRPYDMPFKNPDSFSERVARNQQLILREEAGFGNVIDPAAGSYYIEKLTDMIAEASWKLYLETEEQGGFLEALKKGSIQQNIREAARKKLKDIATRKTVLLGTSQYPNTREKMAEKIDPSFVSEKEQPQNLEFEPLQVFRGAREYEEIRMAIERSGKVPHVFLLTIGNPVMRKARAQFSSVFFGSGGYRVTDNAGFDSVETAVSSAIDSGADIVVICSSDEEYATFAAEIYKNLAGRCIVVIAGNPACTGKLKAAGIEYFIHLKSDVPETLHQFNSMLGIKDFTGK